MVWLDAGKPAVFVGDLTHCPMQLHPSQGPVRVGRGLRGRGGDPQAGVDRGVPGRAAVIPAHYPGHGGATVVARGDAFMVDDWLELPAI